MGGHGAPPGGCVGSTRDEASMETIRETIPRPRIGLFARRSEHGGTIGGLRRLFVRLLVETEGGTLGNKRLPLYDFHRSFRLSWDDTESLVRRSCYYVDYEALWGRYS